MELLPYGHSNAKTGSLDKYIDIFVFAATGSLRLFLFSRGSLRSCVDVLTAIPFFIFIIGKTSLLNVFTRGFFTQV